VLEDISLGIDVGEFVAVAGPNGGGKTTLVRVLLGLERPTAGKALLFGETAHRFSRRRTLGYLAQRSELGGDAPATVREIVSAGRLAAGGLIGPMRRRDRELVAEAISRVGLDPVADLPVRTLSGGMQQRAFIAKALAGEPALLVLDEPTTGVDAESQESLAALLDRLHSDLGVTILYVSHEFGAVERFVQRLVLVRRTIVFDGPPSELPGVWHDPSHTHAPV
jgi:zinc transport system ATP-binding protein